MKRKGNARTTEKHLHLSRRERQIMDIIYQRSEASALDVMESLPDPPGYSATRALLRVLENKGHLKHKKRGARYIFMPTQPRHRAARSALQRVLRTFFDNSAEDAVAAVLDTSSSRLTEEQLDRMAELIEKARKEGR